MSRFLLYIIGFSTVAFGLIPLISTLIASGVANYYGCTLDESTIHPCLIMGADRGELLGALYVFGWFSVVTVPVGMGGAIFLLGLIVKDVAIWARNGHGS